MKYIIRAIKYFLYLAILLTVFVLLLYAFNFVGGSVDQIFKNGVQSIKQIAIVIAVFSAVYPALGYGKRSVLIVGSYNEVRPGVIETMENLGYKLVKEEGENLSFVKRGAVQRVIAMYEDKMTFSRVMNGFEIEGRVKNQVRVISALEARFRA